MARIPVICVCIYVLYTHVYKPTVVGAVVESGTIGFWVIYVNVRVTRSISVFNILPYYLMPPPPTKDIKKKKKLCEDINHPGRKKKKTKNLKKIKLYITKRERESERSIK